MRSHHDPRPRKCSGNTQARTEPSTVNGGAVMLPWVEKPWPSGEGEVTSRTESVKFGFPSRRDGPFSFHQPAADQVAQGAGQQPAEYVGHIVIAAPDCRDTHEHKHRKHGPEQPPAVPPRAPQCRRRTGHVSRREGRTAHPSEMLDEAHHCGERSSG